MSVGIQLSRLRGEDTYFYCHNMYLIKRDLYMYKVNVIMINKL